MRINWCADDAEAPKAWPSQRRTEQEQSHPTLLPFDFYLRPEWISIGALQETCFRATSDKLNEYGEHRESGNDRLALLRQYDSATRTTASLGSLTCNLSVRPLGPSTQTFDTVKIRSVSEVVAFSRKQEAAECQCKWGPCPSDEMKTTHPQPSPGLTRC